MKKNKMITGLLLLTLLSPNIAVFGTEITDSTSSINEATETSPIELPIESTSSSLIVPEELEVISNEENAVETSEKTVPKEASNTTEVTETVDTDEVQAANNAELGQEIEPFEVTIIKKNWDIWDQPYEKGKAKSLCKTTPYFGNKVMAIRESKLPDATYVLVTMVTEGASSELGWINQKGLESTNYGQGIEPEPAMVIKKNWDIWDRPYKKELTKSIANSSDYFAEEVIKMKRAKEGSGSYVLIGLNIGNEIKELGWINENGLESTNYGEVIKQETVLVTRKNWDIWNRPFKKSLTKSISNSNNYFAKEVIKMRRAKEEDSVYVLLGQLVDNEVKQIGWFNESGLSAKITIENVTPEQVRIYKNNWDIWSTPFVSGISVSLNNTKDHYLNEVTITKRAVVGATSYVLVSTEAKELGWLNEKGVGPLDSLTSEEGQLIENKYQFINKKNWTIWEKPYKPGVKTVANTDSYMYDKVLITRLAKTEYGTYAKIWAYRNGKYNFIGWYSEKGLVDEIPEINQSQGELIPNTYGEILKNNWTIWENPYKPGMRAVGNTSNYRYQTILFTRRAKTLSGTYYKMWARVNGKFKAIGWIAGSGTTLNDKVISNKPVSVPMKKVVKKNWTIWNKPYVYGAKSAANSTTYFNKNVQIIAEAKTNYGTYHQIKYMGKIVGWIKDSGLEKLSEFVVPISWINQINTAGYAPSGCAAANIYATTHAKNYAMNRNLTWFYHNLPLHSYNPNIGQVGHPLYLPFTAVISPIGVTSFMNRLGADVENITGKDLEYVKEELRKGNLVMFWGRVGLSEPNTSKTTHVMIFTGYRDGEFLVQDPAYGSIPMGIRWFSESRVNDYLAAKGRKMVVVR